MLIFESNANSTSFVFHLFCCIAHPHLLRSQFRNNGDFKKLVPENYTFLIHLNAIFIAVPDD